MIKSAVIAADNRLGSKFQKSQSPCVSRIAATTRILSKDLVLYESLKDNGSQKPLVLMFSWLTAKQHHVKKHADLFLAKNTDVLTVKLRTKHILTVNDQFHVLSNSIMEHLHRLKLMERKFVIQTFSAGILNYGAFTLNLAKENAEKLKDIQLEVHDSVTPGLRCAAPGIPKAVGIPTVPLQLCLEYLIYLYLNVRKTAVADKILEVENFVYNSPIQCPRLFYYSMDDPLGTPENIKLLMKSLEAAGNKCDVKYFDKSVHVSHLRYHPEEYIATFDQFCHRNLQYFRESS